MKFQDILFMHTVEMLRSDKSPDERPAEALRLVVEMIADHFEDTGIGQAAAELRAMLADTVTSHVKNTG